MKTENTWYITAVSFSYGHVWFWQRNINTMNGIRYWAIAVNNEELLQHVEGRTREEYIPIKTCFILAKNNEHNIFLSINCDLCDNEITLHITIVLY